MKIKTKKSATGNLRTSTMFSDDLYKYYNFETDEHGEVMFQSSFIYRFKKKILKNKEEKYLAWELVQLLKRCNMNLGKIYNFNFHIKDGQIKMTVGSNCAYIKNKLPEYENYLKQLGEEMESYIEFQLEGNGESEEKK